MSLFYVAAQANVNLDANINRKTIPINGSFILSITVKYQSKKPDIFISNLDNLRDFEILSKWQESRRQISFINGRRQSSSAIHYKYRLQPKAKGQLRIESLKVHIDGKSYKTKDFFIVVTQKDKNFSSNPLSNVLSSPFNSNQSLTNIFKDSFNTLNQFNDSDHKAKFQVYANKKTVYKREAIQAQWVLFTPSTIRYEIDKRPKLRDFWKEEAMFSPQGQFLGNTIINNRNYQKVLVDSVVVFPLKEGQLSIDPYSLKLTSFLAGRSIQQVTSKAVPIIVKDLPPDPKKIFSGAVGHYKVEGGLQSLSTNRYEPVAYHLTFVGDGHPQFIKFPDIPFPSSIKTYEPAQKSKFTADKINSKIYEVVLVPTKAGSLTVPSFEVSTFNPDKGEYEYHQIPSFQLQVHPAKTQISESSHFLEEDQKVQSKRFNIGSYWPSFLNHRYLKWIALFCYPLFFSLFLILMFLSFRAKNKISKKTLDKKLKNIEKLLAKQKWQQASLQLIDCCYFVLKSFGSKSDSENWMGLIKKLPPSLYKKHGKGLEQSLHALERINFAPRLFSHQEALNQVTNHHRFLKDILKSLSHTKNFN